MGSIFKKLVKFQGECKGVTLDGFNPHFKSKFCTLGNLVATVTPVLSSVGLGFYHIIKQDSDIINVETRVVDADTERYISSSLQVQANSNPQKLGAAITYYKRYQLAGLLGIAETSDDDGETAETESATAIAISGEKFKQGIDFFKTDTHSADDLGAWFEGKDASFLLLGEPEKVGVTKHLDDAFDWLDRHGKFGKESESKEIDF